MHDEDDFIEWSIRDFERVQECRQKRTRKLQLLTELQNDILTLIQQISSRIVQLETELKEINKKPTLQIIVRDSFPFLKYHRHSCEIVFDCSAKLDKATIIKPSWPSSQIEFLRKLTPPKYLLEPLDERQVLYWARVSNTISGLYRTPLELAYKHHQITYPQESKSKEIPPKTIEILKQVSKRVGWTVLLEQEMAKKIGLKKPVFEWFRFYKTFEKDTWTAKKEQLLIKAVQLYQVKRNSKDSQSTTIQWSFISSIVGMTPRQCKYKYQKLID